ncbi:glycosyltransferase family 4 protein [Streptomyces sp. NPDC049906]|uniref:glycosyltransferase family 4 protein n=1 Tax=Streptomyces sp. NPDC049906 TaxID=3155656 RepID=UPI003441FCF9
MLQGSLTPVDLRPADVRPVHFVMPGTVDDPDAYSGGATYDRRVGLDLSGFGWVVRAHALPGDWPKPDPLAAAQLAHLLAGLPDDSVVLIDGLVAGGVPEVVVPEAKRLRLAVLVHLPLADGAGLDPDAVTELDALERTVLRAVSAVVATSDWAAQRLVNHHGLARRRVHVAAPGADIGPLATGTDGVSRLLCVAAVTPRKGQHRLVRALASVADLPWSCVCVGSLDRDPEYVAKLAALIDRHGLGDRIRLAGPQSGAELHASYASTDLMVLASRAETYGMAVTEALARGIPVLVNDVGGLPEAVGRAPDGSLPGMLLPPDDPGALGAAVRRWFDEHDERQRLKTAARWRRTSLDGWATTARSVSGVLEQLRRDSWSAL